MIFGGVLAFLFSPPLSFPVIAYIWTCLVQSPQGNSEKRQQTSYDSRTGWAPVRCAKRPNRYSSLVALHFRSDFVALHAVALRFPGFGGVSRENRAASPE